MLSFKLKNMLRVWSLRFLFIGLTFSLTGCFRPLYGPSPSVDKDVRQSLKAVNITVLTSPETSNFLKYEFEKGLRFTLTGGSNSSGAKTHRITAMLSETIMPALFNMQEGIATNLLLTATADFKLEPMAGETVLFSGKATTSVIMNQNIQGFANLREERDAHARVARTLADQIYYRLALYFAGRPSSSK
jgi:hypothetical protein